MLCDSEAILEESLMAMDTSELHIERIGDRAVVAPAYQLEEIREALQERGTYPKVIGDVVPPSVLEEDEEDEEEEADTEGDGEEATESTDDEESG